MANELVEVMIDARDALAAGLESRDEIEDPITEALEEARIGEVTGGGGGMGWFTIDVEIWGEDRLPEVLSVIRRTLRDLGLKDSSRSRIRHGESSFPL